MAAQLLQASSSRQKKIRTRSPSKEWGRLRSRRVACRRRPVSGSGCLRYFFSALVIQMHVTKCISLLLDSRG